MKKILFLLLTLILFSCKKESPESFRVPDTTAETPPVQSPETLGKEIFENKGSCSNCHLLNTKVIGPSIKDIAKIYKEKSGDIVLFLKGKGEPLVDPSQFEVMKTNFAITKEMSNEELQALETYIYSSLNKE